MHIALHSSFKKTFKKRILPNQNLVKKYKHRVQLFKKNPSNPILRDHSLKGTKKQKRSFSITGDIRVVYYMKSKDIAVFLDIGSHNQVY